MERSLSRIGIGCVALVGDRTMSTKAVPVETPADGIYLDAVFEDTGYP